MGSWWVSSLDPLHTEAVFHLSPTCFRWDRALLFFELLSLFPGTSARTPLCVVGLSSASCQLCRIYSLSLSRETALALFPITNLLYDCGLLLHFSCNRNIIFTFPHSFLIFGVSYRGDGSRK